MASTPLLVYIVFHPASAQARALAAQLHRALNGDAVIPAMNVPTRFVPEDGTGHPPVESVDWGAAERTFVVVLADDLMAVEQDAPEGREEWGAWVAQAWEDSNLEANRRCVPIQLSPAAWPLDDRLQGVSFSRAFDVEAAARPQWVQRRLIIELLRFLDSKGSGTTAPLKLFVSHAKQDVGAEPLVFQALVAHLDAAHPVDAWVDSAEIQSGTAFGPRIEDGVADSALVVLLTDHYASRSWCMTEVLFAKEKLRPMLVVDALTAGEARAFPYLGNVPTVRWQGDAAAVVAMTLAEVLRHSVAKLTLPAYAQPGDEVLPSAPELATVVRLRGSSVLYPDPPLDQREQDLLGDAGVEASTPLQRFAAHRPLAGTAVAMSYSEADDPERFGQSQTHLDDAAREVSRYLLLAGGTLCYGGHLQEGGYTRALFEQVRAFPAPGIEPVERIVTYVGWPVPLQTGDRATFRHQATFRTTPRPPDLSERDDPEFQDPPTTFFDSDTPLRRFAWARGMSEMRRLQSAAVRARVVIGGRFGPTARGGWYKSRIPGVLDEVLSSLRDGGGQPVYLVGGFGGCARLVADAMGGVHRPELTWAFQKAAPFAPEVRELYKARGLPWESYTEIAEYLLSLGFAGLAERNGLTVDENVELAETTQVSRIVELLLRGLVATCTRKQGQDD